MVTLFPDPHQIKKNCVIWSANAGTVYADLKNDIIRHFKTRGVGGFYLLDGFRHKFLYLCSYLEPYFTLK
jgi:hypothetical protein